MGTSPLSEEPGPQAALALRTLGCVHRAHRAGPATALAPSRLTHGHTRSHGCTRAQAAHAQRPSAASQAELPPLAKPPLDLRTAPASGPRADPHPRAQSRLLRNCLVPGGCLLPEPGRATRGQEHWVGCLLNDGDCPGPSLLSYREGVGTRGGWTGWQWGWPGPGIGKGFGAARAPEARRDRTGGWDGSVVTWGPHPLSSLSPGVSWE